MENPSDSKFSFIKRNRFWFLVVAVAAGLACAGFAGWLAYKAIMPGRLADRAARELAAGDLPAASVSARKALQINPAHLPANKVMTEIADRSGSPEAIMWHRRLVQIAPDSNEAKIRLAESALRFNRLQWARAALDSVPVEHREDATYLATAASFAMATHDRPLARKHMNAALKADPGNRRYQFLNAVLMLDEDSEQAASHRRRIFELLTDDPDLGSSALRALVRDAVATRDYASALAAGRKALADENAPLEEKITYLTLLRAAEMDQFEPYLQALQQESVSRPAEFARLATWMLDAGLAPQVIEWSRQIPDAARHQLPAGPSIAAALEREAAWTELAALLRDSDWDSLNYLRAAQLSRAYREQGDQTWVVPWNLALSLASPDEHNARSLLQLVEKWGWGKEKRALLWSIAERGTKPKWALEQLFAYYKKEGDTQALLRIITGLLAQDPANPVYRNNHAALSLLLDRDLTAASVTAGELAALAPNRDTYASTHAFALLKRGRPHEALRVMNALSAEQLAQPEVAAYYGLILAQTDATELAAKYLRLAEKADLLPEEQRLVREALEKLEAGPF